ISENEPNYEPDCESDCEVRHHITVHRPDRTSPAIILRQEPLRRIVIALRVSSRLPSPALSYKKMYSLLSSIRRTIQTRGHMCADPASFSTYENGEYKG